MNLKKPQCNFQLNYNKHVPVKTHNYYLRPRTEKWICTTKVCLNMASKRKVLNKLFVAYMIFTSLFLFQTYRLQEKSQYMKLIQSQTPNVFSSFLQPFTIQRLGCNQKPPKPSIPLVDLTKDKTNVIVNKSHENVPWKSSNQTIGNIILSRSKMLFALPF